MVGVLVAGAVLQGCAIQNAPVSSDDDFRYLWDATVQLHGVDPYRYPPSAPELAGLRTGFLFPPPGAHCTNRFPGGCTLINRPTGRTIYPAGRAAGLRRDLPAVLRRARPPRAAAGRRRVGVRSRSGCCGGPPRGHRGGWRSGRGAR